MAHRSVKILLLGDGAVGKTSLVRRFVEQRFDESYKMTIGVNVKKRELEDLDMTMMIWDIYGQQLNRELHSSNYSGADGALLVYDLTRYQTFESLDGWIDNVFSVTGNIPFVVLGNKYDLIQGFEESGEDKTFDGYVKENHLEVIESHQRLYGEDPEFSRVPRSDLERWAEDKEDHADMKFSYFLTSAKTGENVEQAFISLGKMLKEGEDI
ncbi:MAG: Rab family GTPase [Candidatus Natronoplasma sp.]